MPRPSGDDVARHYASAHRRIADLARGLDDAQLATAVPATPGWDVHDVLAHLAALTTDALAGRLRGVPTDEVTAQQVADRRGAGVEEILAEWEANVPAICDGARAGLVPANIAVDAVTHEQDIRAALGRGPVPDRQALRFSLELYAFGLRRSLTTAALPVLALQADDSDFAATTGDGEPAATLQASELQLFRVLAGRRSKRQIAALPWTGDASPFLDHLSVFGPVPDVDVDEP